MTKVGLRSTGRDTLWKLGEVAITASWILNGEELPMVDRFKRAAIALGTFLVLSSGTALAQDQLSTANLVQLVVTLGVYDNRCEKLTPRLLADVQRLTLLLDKDAVAAGVNSEHDNVDKAGEAKWCDTLRPVVEKYKDGLFDPTRPR
jgi:hypothetical protein